MHKGSKTQISLLQDIKTDNISALAETAEQCCATGTVKRLGWGSLPEKLGEEHTSIS